MQCLPLVMGLARLRPQPTVQLIGAAGCSLLTSTYPPTRTDPVRRVCDSADMTNPTSRMLQLLSLLQTHRHWSGTDLAGRLGVTTRTIRRDVDRLRELGYPVA